MADARPLAHAYRFKDGSWQMVCQYCEYSATGDELSSCAQDFEEHMFFGEDTSEQHFQYCAEAAQ